MTQHCAENLCRVQFVQLTVSHHWHQVLLAHQHFAAVLQDVQDLLQKMCADLFTERPADAIQFSGCLQRSSGERKKRQMLLQRSRWMQRC
jgi:D-alanyl-D-alanine dipeptidase